ncbi:MAG: anhydro-N-acetylmuramic acid kinase [Chitinophagales bacterium]|nr:anhydro-N-acetylmuramic acid kinase [Chitinophagales bacterium]
MTEYKVMGLMSGSSLDGLDICVVKLKEENSQWQFEITQAETFDYDDIFRNRLRNLPNESAYKLAQMHTEFAKIQAQFVQKFFQKYPDTKDVLLIVSHGQTIFHQPEKGFTTQIGCGATLSALTQKTVVCDLRTIDVALGGQGAPLVPFGEKYLFPAYKSFINIGGICNISLHTDKRITGYDVCPGNTLLNLLSQQLGKSYDAKGEIAKSGSIDQELLQQLNSLPFYLERNAKSLGTEHILSDWYTLIEKTKSPIKDKLRTVIEHIAQELSHHILEKTLLTGGGVHNSFLVERIRHYSSHEIIIPDLEIIDFKEALIIAFVGWMRYLNKNNFLSSVTGAKNDSMGGAIYGFTKYTDFQ